MRHKSNIYILGLTAAFFMSWYAPTQAQPTWHSFEEALAIADSTGRPVLVDVWAPWCGWCHKMKQEVYPALGEKLTKQFVMTRLNRDDHETTYRYHGQKFTPFRLAQKLKAETVPTMILLTPDGEYLLHLAGFREADRLKPVLEYVDRDIETSL